MKDTFKLLWVMIRLAGVILWIFVFGRFLGIKSLTRLDRRLDQLIQEGDLYVD